MKEIMKQFKLAGLVEGKKAGKHWPPSTVIERSGKAIELRNRKANPLNGGCCVASYFPINKFPHRNRHA